MKKAFDQTVRELKREVNKKVLKVPGIEQKILDATSNEPWGPHGALLADIAHATRSHHEYQIILNTIWKRINDTGKNWRHVYKGLTVLEYLVAHGSERVIDEIREHAYQISTLSDFQYIDSSGRDQGNNVRRKSQTLVALVNDKERIQEVRQKALTNRDKYRSTYSTGRPGSHSGTYGDRYDDEQFESRYGSRDEDRNGSVREREWGNKDDDRYGRVGETYNRDGDRYGRDSDEQYGRDSYRDSDYKGRGNSDRERERSFEEDDRNASRGGSGGRSDQDESRLERKLSEQSVSAPPSYEDAVRDAPDHGQGEKNGGAVAAHASKAYSPPGYKAGPPQSSSQDPNHVAGVSASAQNKEVDDFDEFDPRGSLPAVPPASSTSQMDFFGSEALDPISSLALVPVTSFASSSETDIPTDSAFGTTFVASPSASTSMSQPSEDPFGVSPFKATPQGGFPVQQQNFVPPTSFQPTPVAPQMETSPSFDFGDPLGGLTYAPTYVGNGNGQQFSSSPAFLAPESPAPFPQAGAVSSVSSHGAQPAGQGTMQGANMNFLQQTGAAPINHLQQPGPLALQAPLTTTGGSKDKFETKSTVWADTLSRGLVNLNISGAKINPLADIGIDFDSINRMDKRKQEKSSAAPVTSTIAMGKAMGAGSGIGRAAAGGAAPPTNPMMGSTMGVGRGMAGGAGMGMGMGGYGVNMNNQPMGMGMGMNMNMGMGMSQGSMMRPPVRMPGYNPMMGMGSYSSQQPPYGGGGTR